jgi:acyl-CoA dehydrogenase
MSAAPYQSAWINAEARMFRNTARLFVQKEFLPHQARWRAQHFRPMRRPGARRARRTAPPDVAEEYGGGGGTFAHEAVVLEELAQRRGALRLDRPEHGGALPPRLRREDQKRRWLPAHGARRAGDAIAMTEPGTGSDLQAIRTRPAATASTTSSTAPRPSSPTASTPT